MNSYQLVTPQVVMLLIKCTGEKKINGTPIWSNRAIMVLVLNQGK